MKLVDVLVVLLYNLYKERRRFRDRRRNTY
nr:MAG TPA: hypothetical protein [Caudoviricetes sp.]